MKKLISMGLTLAMILSLAACGGSGSKTEENKETKTENTSSEQTDMEYVKENSGCWYHRFRADGL